MTLNLIPPHYPLQGLSSSMHELLLPHIGQHLRPHHVSTYIIHLLAVIISACSLPVVILGEDCQLGRVALLSRVNFSMSIPLFLDAFSSRKTASFSFSSLAVRSCSTILLFKLILSLIRFANMSYSAVIFFLS